MKRRYFVIFAGILILLAGSASAQSLSDYLSDKTDTALRLQISQPEEAKEKEEGWFNRLRLFLGARKVARIKPEVGTVFTVQSSAYAPSPYQTDATPCVTAAGTRVRPGVVASNFLPLGTILEIEGEQFIVEDRMNPRFDGYYLDLWFPSTSSALKFGRKELEVKIVLYGEPGQTIREQEVAEEDNSQESEKIAILPEPANQGFWDSVKTRIFSFGSLIGVRQSTDVDKYDVDCLSEEEDEQE